MNATEAGGGRMDCQMYGIQTKYVGRIPPGGGDPGMIK